MRDKHKSVQLRLTRSSNSKPTSSSTPNSADLIKETAPKLIRSVVKTMSGGDTKLASDADIVSFVRLLIMKLFFGSFMIF